MNVKPLCPVFGECGGCLYQDIDYKQELALKEEKLKTTLKKEINIKEGVFKPAVASPKPYNYRHRLDLKLIRTKDDRVLVGFTPSTGRGILTIDNCFIADEAIVKEFPQLKKEIVEKLKDNSKYRRANICVRTSDDGRVFWGGIGKRSTRLAEEDYFWTKINNRKIFYSLDTFFQANLSILPKLFETIGAFDFFKKDVTFYDLYGGVGLFGLGLIDKVKQVILIEESLSSLKLARYNINYHNINNINIIEGRVEDRLENILNSDASALNVVMIDPPRAGLSQSVRDALESHKNLDYMMYLSCNPDALARDLADLCSVTWEIKEIIPFDFFPKTRHLETLVLLKNKA
ncbi:MAG: RsmD family RNA methyltransferase [Candidatus Zapsychrus exili]|nr:RsmD family RNA methyltransferase [Candidatus Zapsychrus exili]